MPEKLDPRQAEPTPEMLHVIAESWQQFAILANDPSVQEFAGFQSRYRREMRIDSDFNFLRFDPQAESFTPDMAAGFLDASHKRSDEFLTGILRAYTESKKQPVPDAADTKAVGETLFRVLNGGVSKIYQYMNRAGLHSDDHQRLCEDQTNHLAPTLLHVAVRLRTAGLYDIVNNSALESNISQAEINDLLDADLQAACQGIQQGRKYTAGKDSDITEKIFASTINCLGALYNESNDASFQRQLLLIMAMWDIRKEGESAEEIRQKIAARERAEVLKIWQSAFIRFNNAIEESIGVRVPYPDPTVMQKTYKEVIELDQAELAGGKPARESEIFAKLARRLWRVHAARHFINAIAGGSIRYSRVLEATNMLYTQPFSSVAEVEIPEVALDWEVLPYDQVLSGGGIPLPPPPELGSERSEHTRQLDWERIQNLIVYLRQWGGGYIARSVESSGQPTLSPDKQYYVAVLPESDGREHALADHPLTGNGVYIWRAETAQLRDIVGRNQDLAWRDVLCHPKRIARMLGARRFYHTDNLDFNILNYLTMPAAQLALQRYAVGKGTLSLIRMAQQNKSEDRLL